MPSVIPQKFRNVAVTNTPLLVGSGNLALVGFNLINPISTLAYLKLYNAVQSSDVTVGLTIPSITLMIPALGLFWQSNEDKFQEAFNLGIVCAVTTGISDTDNTAPATGCYVGLRYNTNI